MNSITQEAKKRQGALKLAKRKGIEFAAAMYGVSESSIKRWRRRWDGTWQSLKSRSHKPLSPHPKQHTAEEEALIRKAFGEKFFRYGWIEVYNYLVDKLGYTRSYSGMRDAAKRMKLAGETAKRKSPRKQDRRFPEKLRPGESVQFLKNFPPCITVRKRV